MNASSLSTRCSAFAMANLSLRVGAAGVASFLAMTNVKAPKNGYCYIYISNESGVDVFFDNLQACPESIEGCGTIEVEF
jgi:hypothetical protein